MEGVPYFCDERHFDRSLGALAVPLWELPRHSSEWLFQAPQAPETVDPYESASLTELGVCDDADLLFDDASLTDSESECCSDASAEFDDASPSISGLDDGDLSASSQWHYVTSSKRAPVFCRRVEQTWCTVSSAIVPPSLIGSDSSELDRQIGHALRGRAPTWAVLALRHGNFAGAIFEGPRIKVHKTFSAYTIRRKQGRAQSSKDTGGKNAQSAGANLRRHCQQRLAENLQSLLAQDWKTELNACEIIFVHVSKQLQSTLIGNAQQQSVPHTKVRRLPFPLERITLAEVEKAYKRISCVVFRPLVVDDATHDEAPQSIRSAALPPLHAAASACDTDQIWMLLEDGADPTARDERGFVPYQYALRPAARRAFHTFRDLRPDLWDWNAAELNAANAGPQDASLRNAVQHRRRNLQRPDSSQEVAPGKDDDAKQGQSGRKARSTAGHVVDRGPVKGRSQGGVGNQARRQQPSHKATPKGRPPGQARTGLDFAPRQRALGR